MEESIYGAEYSIKLSNDEIFEEGGGLNEKRVQEVLGRILEQAT